MKQLPFYNKQIKRRVELSSREKLRQKSIINDPLIIMQYKDIMEYRKKIKNKH